MKIIEVTWHDAVLRPEFNDSSHIAHRPEILHSCGFLLKSDRTGVSLCTDYAPSDGTFREQSFIPRGMIIAQKIFGDK
jgi:hypothetical protein